MMFFVMLHTAYVLGDEVAYCCYVGLLGSIEAACYDSASKEIGTKVQAQTLPKI
jgi:hypothetical protein